MRDSLRHSRRSAVADVCAYGLAVRRLLEGTPDYTERCSELRAAFTTTILYGQRGFLLSFLTTIVKWAKCSF